MGVGCKEVSAITNPVEHEVTNYRVAASQFCAVGTLCIIIFTNGSSFGLITVLLAELSKEDSEIKVSLEELSWIGSLNYLLIPVGNLLSGLAGDYLGRHTTLALLATPYLVAWVSCRSAWSVGVLLGSIGLTGLAGGLLEGTAITFTAEISQPHLRSVLSSTAIAAGNFGMFLEIFLGRFVSWRSLVLANIVLTLAYAVAMYWIPESPHWLASKGRYAEAENALAWLRGWALPSQVEDEFNEMRGTFDSTRSAPTTITNVESFDDFAEEPGTKSIYQRYLQRSFVVPFVLVGFTFFLAAFNGSNSVLTYSVIMFGKMRSPIDEYNAGIIASFFNLIGTTMFAFAISCTGKRKLVLLTMSMSGLAYIVSSVLTFFFKNTDSVSEIYNWIPTVFVLLSTFLSAVGVNMIPYILTGEVFSIHMTNLGTGASVALYNVFTWLNNKTYLNIVEGVGISGTFLFTALINIFGCVVLYVVLPETEGKALKEIQEHFSKPVKSNTMKVTQ
ncbi:facilitated trehalose transporter Tret1-like [Copidosoma floridanum]|uniref:facilitated trehalose transporter Tret1-like n=1 Tax=Copidosoma floridanum TaxID=29053 RepID=UPI0006C97400|nr:facilitated trehalose transporter Tret1-like [Copidosoma floridanum]